MTGWLDPILFPSTSRVGELELPPGLATSPVKGGAGVDLGARFATSPVGGCAGGACAVPKRTPPPMPPPPPPPAWFTAGATSGASVGGAALALSPGAPAPSILEVLFGGGATMPTFADVLGAASTVGDKVLAFRKADADANLARARLEADARLREVAIRTDAGASGLSLPALPGLGTLLVVGGGVALLLAVVKALR